MKLLTYFGLEFFFSSCMFYSLWFCIGELVKITLLEMIFIKIYKSYGETTIYQQPLTSPNRKYYSRPKNQPDLYFGMVMAFESTMHYDTFEKKVLLLPP